MEPAGPTDANVNARQPSATLVRILHIASRIVLAITAAGSLGLATLMLVRAGTDASLAQAVVFYLLPLAVGTGSLMALRAKPETNIQIALVIVSTVTALLIGELVLSAVPRRVRPSPADGDTRRSVDVVLDLRTDGRPAVPNLPATWLRSARIDVGDGQTVLPLASAPGGVVVVLCHEAGRWVAYEADRHGFNNPDSLWDDRPVDVVTIGDSFTHGACVPQDRHYVTLVRRRWPSTVNLGVSGSGPLHQLAVVREYATLLRPRTVLWVYFEGNDIFDLREELAVPPLRAYLADAAHRQQLADRQPVIDASLLRHINARIDSTAQTVQLASDPRGAPSVISLLRLSSLRAAMGFGVLAPRRLPEIDEIRNILLRAQETIAAWGGDMVFVYLPDLVRFHQRVGEGVRGRREILRVVGDLGIPVVDLTDEFNSAPNPDALYNGLMGHYSPEGNDLVGNAIVRGLSALERERSPSQR